MSIVMQVCPMAHTHTTLHVTHTNVQTTVHYQPSHLQYVDVCLHVSCVRGCLSTWFQAHKTNDGSLASTMFLPLAEKLMEKYVAEKKLDVEEGLPSLLSLSLYLLILFCLFLLFLVFSAVIVNVVMVSQFV